MTLNPKQQAFAQSLVNLGLSDDQILDEINNSPELTAQPTIQPEEQVLAGTQEITERVARGETSPLRGFVEQVGEAAKPIEAGLEKVGEVIAPAVRPIIERAAEITPEPVKEILGLPFKKFEEFKQGLTPENQRTLEAALRTVGVATALAPVGIGAKVGTEAALAKRATVKVASAREEIKGITGKIIQGESKDVAKATRALGDIDTIGVKTFEDLRTQAIEPKSTALKAELDEFLDQDKRSFTLDDLEKTVKAGKEVLTKNPVRDALDQLEELYDKTKDIDNLARIKELKIKADGAGISARELNDLAREHGGKLKAFSPTTGTPPTSVTKQAFENTRKGVKTSVRDQFKSEIPKAIDARLSDLIQTEKLVTKMEKKVNSLTQKIQKRGVLEKLARATGRTVDVLTGGAIRGFLTSFLPSNIGNKVLNSLDLQDQLKKNLTRFERLLKIVDEEALVKEIAKDIPTLSLGAGVTAAGITALD